MASVSSCFLVDTEQEGSPITFAIGLSLVYLPWYGYIKNHMKTVKNGQARTRERKSVQKPEAKPEKVKPPVNLGQQKSTKPKIFQNSPSSFKCCKNSPFKPKWAMTGSKSPKP
ncbi:hypothetical protein Tco_1456720 [Tanacetum coccineum]